MSATEAQRDAIKLLGGDESPISPQGTCSTQESGDSLYALFPQNLTNALDVEPGTTMALGFHAPSNTLLVTPKHCVTPDHWASEYVLD